MVHVAGCSDWTEYIKSQGPFIRHDRTHIACPSLHSGRDLWISNAQYSKIVVCSICSAQSAPTTQSALMYSVGFVSVKPSDRYLSRPRARERWLEA